MYIFAQAIKLTKNKMTTDTNFYDEKQQNLIQNNLEYNLAFQKFLKSNRKYRMIHLNNRFSKKVKLKL